MKEEDFDHLTGQVCALEQENHTLRETLGRHPMDQAGPSALIGISALMATPPLPAYHQHVAIRVFAVEDEAFQHEVLKALFARW